MITTAVICGRNDNYGGRLIERASFSLNGLLQVFDEVIYVDWNTDPGKKILSDELNLTDRSNLKVITVTSDRVKKIITDDTSQKMCEVLARNIAIRRAKGDIIVSTNIDIIPPPKEYLDILMKSLQKDEMITLTRNDIEIDELLKNVKPETLNLNHLPLLFGAKSIQNKIEVPFTRVNRQILEKYPVNTHLTLSSIITGCGDFQVAHKELWYKIRGFEESMTKRLYNDTNVQYKVIMSGGNVTASNFPPIYHLNHERNEDLKFRNSPEMAKKTANADDWGFANESFE